jgi:dolichol-phosphate mannosyltransferase
LPVRWSVTTSVSAAIGHSCSSVRAGGKAGKRGGKDNERDALTIAVMAARPRVTLLVPVLDEEAVLPPLLVRLAATADRIERSATIGADVELLFVDDGSTDRSFPLLREAAQRDPRIGVLRLSRRFGHAMALSAGLAAARGDAVAILDADLQDPPELVDEFLQRWRAGHEVVYGVRRRRTGGGLKRWAYAAYYRLLRRSASIEIPLDAGDFCLLDRRVVDLLVALPERSRFLRGLRSWAGFRQVGVPYDRPARAAGRAKYSWRGLFDLGLDGLLSFSHLPLRLVSVAGLVSAALALLGVAFYFVWWLVGFELGGRRPQDVAGFMTLTTLVLFFAGVQLLALGLVGEYVGRVFVEVKQRPGWVVAEKVGVAAREESPG